MSPHRRHPLERRKQMIVLTAWIVVVALVVGALASLVFINLR
jgi:hypothetical protein